MITQCRYYLVIDNVVVVIDHVGVMIDHVMVAEVNVVIPTSQGRI